MRQTITVLLILTMTGCSMTVEAPPCDDAGTSASGDAMVATGSTITASAACRILENTQLAHDSLRTCPIIGCPWPAVAGPGAPRYVCDPVRIIDCAEAIDRTNDCVRLDSALANCDTDACWEDTER